MRAAQPGKSSREYMRLIAANWKTLDPAQKKEYAERAKTQTAESRAAAAAAAIEPEVADDGAAAATAAEGPSPTEKRAAKKSAKASKASKAPVTTGGTDDEWDKQLTDSFRSEQETRAKPRCMEH